MDDRAQDLADKAEIVELMTRYCFAVDFRDFEQLRTVFATDADATYVLSPLNLGLEDVHLSGVDAIVEWLSSVLGNLGEPGPRHAMTNYLIEIHGDHAHSRNYLAGGGGLYTVDHVRTPDGWRAGAVGDAQLPAPYSSFWLIAHAALISPMWLKAWGKLPSSSPVSASTSSARRPTSLT